MNPLVWASIQLAATVAAFLIGSWPGVFAFWVAEFVFIIAAGWWLGRGHDENQRMNARRDTTND